MYETFPQDKEDEPSTRFQFQHEVLELENPDETDGEETETDKSEIEYGHINYSNDMKFTMFDKTGPHHTNQEQYSAKNREDRKQGEMRESLREIGVNSYNYETEQYRIEEKS